MEGDAANGLFEGTSREGLPPRIVAMEIKNFRALKHIRLSDLTPMTVLLGPNGSGKSTVFDALSFLSECFRFGLRHAWDKRGRARELVSRGQTGPVEISIKYKEQGYSIVTYHIEVTEERGAPVVAREWLSWRRKNHGQPFRFLDYERGHGRVISGDSPEEDDQRIEMPLSSPDLLAVNTLGQLSDHPRVAALRNFITDWHISHLSVEESRAQPETGPQERISRSGNNVANVVQYLQEQHPDRLEMIFRKLQRRVPKLERVIAEVMQDGRLLLQIKDFPFDRPVLAKFASDGTLKMLAYLLLLHDPRPPRFIGIEEPENFLHPRLLAGLAEECQQATERAQVFATTHSPYFINGMDPSFVWTLFREEDGFTRALRASDVAGVFKFLEQGAALGDLWMEGHLGAGDPNVNGGAAMPTVARSLFEV